MLLQVEHAASKKDDSISKDSPKSNKRRRSVVEKDDTVPKKFRKDSISVNHSVGELTEERSDEVHEILARQSFKFSEHKSNLPRNVVELMYRLDLSVLCLFRKLKCESKYHSLSLKFGDTEMNKFNDIIIGYGKKTVHVQIENVDKYYSDKSITYAELFAKEREKHRFSINNYFNSFFEQVIYKPELLNSIEYLVVYTNAQLDITKINELKSARFKQFYPYKFDKMGTKACTVLKDFLLTSEQKPSFYQFSREESNREELLKRLQFSTAMMKVANERKLEPEFVRNMKSAFIDKLVFAVDQPSRYRLNRIVKTEIKQDNKFEDDYVTLQEEVLHALTAPEKSRIGNYVAEMTYEFHVLMSFLHTMYLHKHMASINFEIKTSRVSNNIIINYNDRITRLEVNNTDTSITYNQLFPVAKNRDRTRFSINKYFAFFIEELNDDIRYFVIYTNAGLDLTEDKELKKTASKDFHPLKFDEIDVGKKKYKVLRNCPSINKNGLYKFSSEETTKEKLMSLLEIPATFLIGKENFSTKCQREIKEKFLHKLIFAVNQPNRIALTTSFKEEVGKSNESNDAPYEYEELHEITLRWLESGKSDLITKEIMNRFLEDIRNDKSSFLECRDIDAEIKFAKRVAGNEGTPGFNKFLDFLIGEGKTCLGVLKENGTALINMFNILSGSKANATRAFKELYSLWFDKEGNKTRYMEILGKDETQYLENMYKILHGSGQSAADNFKNLFNLWFDEEGNKTYYLRNLEKEGISLFIMSKILCGTRTRVAKVLKDLHDVWFDEEGNKTVYVRNLEKEGMSLTTMCSTLEKAKANAPKAFIDFYNLLFDKEGNKTQYLKMLQREGINLMQISNLLIGVETNCIQIFKDLYELFFDEEGNKTKCLETLEKEGVRLFTVLSIMGKVTESAKNMFRTLYNLWFDEIGNKTRCVETLEKNGVRLFNISNILVGTRSFQADIVFQNLYSLWFDEQGNKTQYLETFEREGVALLDICNTLDGTGSNAIKVFWNLYDVWFDAQGNRKKHLDHFIKKQNEEDSFTALNLLNILIGANMKVNGVFESLHNVCFNDEGQKTELLDDLYNAGFKASYLSCLLYKSGIYASHCLRRLHIVCFDEKREKTKLLNDFYEAGFKPRDLCNILSGAPQIIEKFHDFCFVGETKMYLRHFRDNKDSFTIRNLCNIFYGAQINICTAFEDFHDVCFDATGNKTKILNDFHQAGFTSKYLSNILFMSGNNAASVLKDFHKLCFGEKNYLTHFFTDAELFAPKNLSKLLRGVESNISLIFEKLHDTCFDEAGRKTKYFKKLIKNNPEEMLNILHAQVRSTPIA